MRPVLLLTFLLEMVLSCNHVSKPLVRIREGQLQGEFRRSAAGATFYSFKGIPYAQAPVGDLRYRPPQRHCGWSGTLNATRHGSRCLQYNIYNKDTKEGTEDCLFANVYTRRLSHTFTAGLPVMVWIHGGSFTVGSGEDTVYGPEYFMDQNIVLVTFNFRLGPLALYSTFDGNAPGNLASQDQILLLQWVKDNIASFGGNPNWVTIFGESSGGVSVSMLVLSPLAKGLFHRAITQSGSVLADWAVSGKRTGATEKFESLVNCTDLDKQARVECLRQVSADDIIDAFKVVRDEVASIPFQPRVDAEAEHPVLPEDPRALLERGEFNQVPWINGGMEEEGAIYLYSFLKDPKFVAGVEASTPEALGLLAGITRPSLSNILECGANATVVSADVLHFYAGNGSLKDNNYIPIVQIMGDRSYHIPMSEEVRLASKHTSVYKYVIDHKGPGRQSQLAERGIESAYGPTHTDDLNYLFKEDDLPIPPLNSPSYRMIRFVVDIWTNFARSGRPWSAVFPMPYWPAFDQLTQRHMRINSKASVGERLFGRRVDFWQSLPFNEPWKRVVDTQGCL